MRHLALIDDLQADVVLKVLVGRAADMEVDLGLLAGNLEVPLAKHVVLAFLQWHEVARVLLAHIVHLRDKVVLLRDDRNLAHRGANPESVALRCHHVRQPCNQIVVHRSVGNRTFVWRGRVLWHGKRGQ